MIAGQIVLAFFLVFFASLPSAFAQNSLRAPVAPRRAAAMQLTQVVAARAHTTTLQPLISKEDHVTCVIPFEYDYLTIPTPVVQIRINGSAPIAVTMDTGSPYPLVLDASVVKKLRLHGDSNSTLLGSGPTRLRRVDIRTVTLVGLTRNDDVTIPFHRPGYQAYEMTHAPLSFAEVDSAAFRGLPPVGIIGLPAIRPYFVQFNYPKSQLRLISDSRYHVIASSGASIGDLVKLRGEYVPIVMGSIGKDTQEFAWAIDTGSSLSSISPEAMSRLAPLAATAGQSASLYHSGQEPVLLLDQLLIGDLTFREVSIGRFALLPERVGLIGDDLFRRFVVSLDFRHGKIELQPVASKDSRSADRYGATLVRLGQRANKQFYISSVAPGSLQVASSGLRLAQNVRLDDKQFIGADVLTVDGTPLTNLPLIAATRFLNGYGNTHASLELRLRNGRIAVISYMRPDMFDSDYAKTLFDPYKASAPFQAMQGKYWQKEAGKYVLRADTPGVTAGVATNDRASKLGAGSVPLTAPQTVSALPGEGARPTSSILLGVYVTIAGTAFQIIGDATATPNHDGSLTVLPTPATSIVPEGSELKLLVHEVHVGDGIPISVMGPASVTSRQDGTVSIAPGPVSAGNQNEITLLLKSSEAAVYLADGCEASLDADGKFSVSTRGAGKLEASGSRVTFGGITVVAQTTASCSYKANPDGSETVTPESTAQSEPNAQGRL